MVLGTMSCLTVMSSAAIIAEDGEYNEIGEMVDKYWELDDSGLLVIKRDCEPTWGSYAGFIKNVIIEEVVTFIPNSAFAGYPLLESVEIKSGSVAVSAGAFQCCPKLTELNFGMITSIGDYAVYDCDALESVRIGGGLPVDTVGENVFKSCDALKSVWFGNGTREIGYGMFEDCIALETVVIPDSVASIGAHAFENCVSLTEINVPDSTTSVGNYAFYNCVNVKSVYIGHKANSVGEYAFGNNTSLEDVEIASEMAQLSKGMFYGCTALKSLADLPDGIKTIGDVAFKGCSSLSEITIPSTVISIGASAFDGTALTTIDIPWNVAEIGDGAFTNCAALTDINVDAKNASFADVDGALYDDALAILLCCPAGKTDIYTVKSGTTEIADGAFIGCKGLTTVEIPASVNKISNNAFNDCDPSLVFKTNCDNVAVAYAEARGYATELIHSEDAEVKEILAPTCTEDGTKAIKCTKCTHVFETQVIDKLGHSYDNGVITKKATCDEDGVVTITCTREGCGASYTETIPATNHQYNEGVVVLEPTCDTTGIKRFTCKNEGCYKYYEIELKALGHAYDKGVITTEATCETDGVMTYSCTREGCNASYTEVIPATGHAYDSGVITTEATCDTNGVKTFTCANCDAQYTEEIAAIGHNYVETVIKPATCKEDGTTRFTCTNCADTYDVATQGEHKPYSAPVKEEATCEEDGHEGTLCSICHEFIGEYTTTPATGHNYENGVCTSCGAEDEEYMNTPPATPALKSAKNTKNGIKVTWEGVENAKYYRVYRHEIGDKTWTYLGTVEGTSYTDRDVQNNKTWKYTVRAVGNNGKKSGYESGIKITSVATPALKSVINLKNGIRVMWNEVEGAKSYRVYRRGTSGGWKLLATVKTTKYVDSTAKTGKYYTYTVKAVNGDASGYESGLKLKRVDAPVLLKAVNNKNGIKVTWGEVSNAKYYRVYRRAAGESSWTYIGRTTKEYFVDKAVKNSYGKKFTYTVRAIDGNYKSDYNPGVTIKRAK